MKKIVATIVIITIGFYAFSQVKNLPENSTFYDFLEIYTQNRATPEEVGLQVERLGKIWGVRLSPDGNTERASNAIINYAENYQQYTNRSYNPNWIDLGPTGTSGTGASSCNIGRVHFIRFDPNYNLTIGGSLNQTIYAGSSYGGLWKTENDGLDWFPLTHIIHKSKSS